MTKDRNVENHISFQQMYEWMVFGLNKDKLISLVKRDEVLSCLIVKINVELT